MNRMAYPTTKGDSNAINTDSIRIPEVSIDIFSVMARISGENPSARKEYINAAARVSVTK